MWSRVILPFTADSVICTAHLKFDPGATSRPKGRQGNGERALVSCFASLSPPTLDLLGQALSRGPLTGVDLRETNSWLRHQYSIAHVTYRHHKKKELRSCVHRATLIGEREENTLRVRRSGGSCSLELNAMYRISWA